MRSRRKFIEVVPVHEEYIEKLHNPFLSPLLELWNNIIPHDEQSSFFAVIFCMLLIYGFIFGAMFFLFISELGARALR